MDAVGATGAALVLEDGSDRLARGARRQARDPAAAALEAPADRRARLRPRHAVHRAGGGAARLDRAPGGDGARARPRGHARRARPGDPPPRQEQPADGRVAASPAGARSRRTIDPRRALDDSVNRILAIAAVHEVLTEQRDDDVALGELIERLRSMLVQGLGADKHVEAELEEVSLAGRPRDRARARLQRAAPERARARRRRRARRARAAERRRRRSRSPTTAAASRRRGRAAPASRSCARSSATSCAERCRSRPTAACGRRSSSPASRWRNGCTRSGRRGARSSSSDATDDETTAMREHFAYLKRALADGRLVLAGPATDGLFPGIVVFEAADEEEARAFMEADPAVRAGVMLADLHPFRVSLLRGRPAFRPGPVCGGSAPASRPAARAGRQSRAGSRR